MAVRSLEEVPVYTGLTYEKYLELPEIKQRYDIVDGDLFMSPAPSFDHQWELQELYDRLKPFVVKQRMGVVVMSPHDVIIRRLPRMQTRQPDLSFYAKESIGGATRAAAREAIKRDVPPDLAVELLSSSEYRRRVEAKLADYAAVGVGEVWQVDPEAKAILVLRLQDGAYHLTAHFSENEELTSDLLPGFAMRVGEIFE